MFTLDDSGSMDWDYMPDEALHKSFTTMTVNNTLMQYRSSALNRIFYDPTVRYIPWQKSDTSFYPDSIPDKAKNDPQKHSTTTNLVDTGKTSDSNGKNCTHNPYYAFYYKYTGTDPTKNASFTRVDIKSDMADSFLVKTTGRTDCAGAKCTYAEEIQNFANWYTYYRKRMFTAIAGVSQAFNPLDGKQRMGYGQINSGSTSVDGVSNNTVMLGVRDFSAANRDAFYTKLLAANGSGNTPLRRAMDDVGKYFARTDAKGPWAEHPGSSKGVEYSCRKTFHILMTDGYWNNTAASTSGTSDADSVDGPVITGPKGQTYQYKPSVAGTLLFKFAQKYLGGCGHVLLES